MNSKIGSGWDEVKGRTKEEVGHATGDTRTEAEGFGARIKSRVEHGFADVKDRMKRGMDKLREDRGEKTR